MMSMIITILKIFNRLNDDWQMSTLQGLRGRPRWQASQLCPLKQSILKHARVFETSNDISKVAKEMKKGVADKNIHKKTCNSFKTCKSSKGPLKFLKFHIGDLVYRLLLWFSITIMIKHTRGHLGRVFLLKQPSFKKRYKDEKLKIRTSYLHLLVVHHLPDPLVHDHRYLDLDHLDRVFRQGQLFLLGKHCRTHQLVSQ